MLILKIKLEYGCFPIWQYDDKDNVFIDNSLPEFLNSDNEIYSVFIELQNRFEALFINNDK